MSATDVVRVVVDAMGGDYAPAEPVKGAVDALKENERLRIILVGKPEMIRQELAKYQYDETRMGLTWLDSEATQNASETRK